MKPWQLLCLAALAASGLSSCRLSQLSPQRLFERVSGSVVVIRVGTPDGDGVQGSGVVVKPGILATNAHVVAGRPRDLLIRVERGSVSVPGFVCYASPTDDIALLRFAEPSFLPASIEATDGLRVGERVFAVGSSKGFEATLSEGLVSGIRRVPGSPPRRLLQITAPISHGSSGGALFDGRGRLLGITTSSIREGQNLNFAIPSEVVQQSIVEADSPEWLDFSFGMILLASDQSGRAAAFLSRCVAADPTNAVAWLSLGDCKPESLVQERAGCYQTAVDRNPALPDAQKALAKALRELERLEGDGSERQRQLLGTRRTTCERLTTLAPDDPEGWEELGAALNGEGEPEEAAIAYRRALKIEPTRLTTLLFLAYVQEQLGQPAAKVQMWRTVSVGNPRRLDDVFAQEVATAELRTLACGPPRNLDCESLTERLAQVQQQEQDWEASEKARREERRRWVKGAAQRVLAQLPASSRLRLESLADSP